MATYLGILVSITATLMAVAPLLQIRKILKHRHAADISQSLFWIVALGTACLSADAFYTHNLFIAIPNAFSSGLNTITALLIYKYTPAKSAE